MPKFANLEFTPLQKNLYSNSKNEMGPAPVFTSPTLKKMKLTLQILRVCGGYVEMVWEASNILLGGHLMLSMVRFKLNIGFVKMDSG